VAWTIYVRSEARRDLRRLPKKLQRAAKGIIDSLADDPYIGKPCRPPLVGARKIQFWSADYRLVWLPNADTQEVDVLAARNKKRDAGFYDDVAGRM
jgi:mRNA-degrading endonuclease RelE of RelBE toxin-antitoxin system